MAEVSRDCRHSHPTCSSSSFRLFFVPIVLQYGFLPLPGLFLITWALVCGKCIVLTADHTGYLSSHL